MAEKKKFKATVTRVYHSTVTFELEAENEEQAKELADDMSGDYEGSLQLGEVIVDYVEEI